MGEILTAFLTKIFSSYDRYTYLSLFLLWCSAVCGLGMKRTVVVEDVTIFASGADGKDNRNAEIAET